MTSGETRCQTLHHINHIDQSLHYYSGMVINFSIHTEKPSYKSSGFLLFVNVSNYHEYSNTMIILHKIQFLGTLKSFWCKYEHCLWRKCLSHDIHWDDLYPCFKHPIIICIVAQNGVIFRKRFSFQSFMLLWKM